MVGRTQKSIVRGVNRNLQDYVPIVAFQLLNYCHYKCREVIEALCSISSSKKG